MKKTIKLIIMGTLMLTSSFTFAASKKSIVCTTFPEYDWVMNILGENASKFDVTLLQDNGTDLHSYQPSIKDVTKISNADLFVYVGGESDVWVDEVISQSVNKNQIVVNMLEVLGDKVREEEIVEGMQAENEDKDEHHHHDGEGHHHEHDEAEDEHHHHHHHDDEEEIEYDEHVWLSLNNAIDLTNAICEEISKIDSANASVYAKNTAAYTNQLSDLDGKYKKVVSAASKNTVLFGDRFPFRYLTDDYNLKYYAAFVGCSAETEASFETIIFLANKVDELGLNAVLTIEKGDKKIAETIVHSTKNQNQEILELDSLQSITTKEIKAGRNYLSAMKKNLDVLKKALK